MADKVAPSSAAAGSSSSKAEPAAGTVTAGPAVSNAEVDLRADNARLDQENRELRALLAAAGGFVPEPKELRFTMSEGVRQDLILLRHRVAAGELKEEDAVIADPATGRRYTLADISADEVAIPGLGDGKGK